jgi:hypothetical protein
MAKKKAATKDEREHMSKVASLGCWVCQRPANVHHIRPIGLGIGRRSSHYDTIPLCHSHHVGNFSIHNCKQQFEDMYGKETFILQEVKKLVADMEQANDLFNFYNKHKGEL